MTDPLVPGRWLRFGGAIALGTLALASCTGAGPSASPTALEPTTTSVETVTPDEAEVDGAAALRAALESMESGYSFESLVLVGGEEVTRITGWSNEGGVQALVEAGSAEIEYLITPRGRWSRDPGGAWLKLSGESPVTDPLSALVSPQVVEAEEREGSLLLRAWYPVGTLGLEGEGLVEVEVMVTGGVISSLTYSSPLGERTATVSTSFTGVGSAPPVTIPGA